jgi:chromosomal replication initiation ATPase DnaA
VTRNPEIPESRELFHEISFKEILTEIRNRFLLSNDELRKRNHLSNPARKICFYLLKKYTQLRNEDIAQYFGVGHSLVSKAQSRLIKEMIKDDGLARTVEDIETSLKRKCRS